MKKEWILTAAILATLQTASSVAMAAPASVQSNKKTIAQTQTPIAPAVPTWISSAFKQLAADGLIVLRPGGTATMTRDDMALVVARISVDMEAEESQQQKITPNNYDATLEQLGVITKKIAKLEEIERRTPTELSKYKEAYAKAEKELDIWAERSAAAELADIDGEGTKQVSMKYKEALQNFGRITKKLAQIETGREDRQLYLKQLKEEKAAVYAKLHNDAQSLAKEDVAQLKGEKQPNSLYTEKQKQLIRRLQDEFTEELTIMGYGQSH